VLGLLLAAAIGSGDPGEPVPVAGAPGDGPAASRSPARVGDPTGVPGFARFVAAEGAPRLAVSEVEPRERTLRRAQLDAVSVLTRGADGGWERQERLTWDWTGPAPDAVFHLAIAARADQDFAVGVGGTWGGGSGPRLAWWSLTASQADSSGWFASGGPPTYERPLFPLAAVDAALWGQRLVLGGEGSSRAAGPGVCVVVADWGEWSQWPKAAMALSHCSSPTIAAVDGRALFVSGTTADARSLIDRPSPGLIRLAYSPDGAEWTELPPPPTWEKPHTSALAVDSELGLFLVYTAEGGHEGWPVYAQRSPDFGQTWGKPLMLTRDTIHAVWPDATFYDGDLYVSYLEVPNEPSPEGEMFLQPATGAYVMVVDAADIPLP